MPTEITSVPDRGRIVSLRKLARIFQAFNPDVPSRNRIHWRSIFALLAITCRRLRLLVRSYKYYSRIIVPAWAAGTTSRRASIGLVN